jgi:hypothetical protein
LFISFSYSFLPLLPGQVLKTRMVTDHFRFSLVCPVSFTTWSTGCLYSISATCPG